MNQDLLDSLAATTLHRDRDDLDQAFARLLLQWLEPQSISLFRVIDDAGVKRLARRLRISQDAEEISAESTEDLRGLPTVADNPAWQECYMRRTIVRQESSRGHSTLFPVVGGDNVGGLLIIEDTAELTAREVGLVDGFLGILRNHLSLLDYGELDTLTGLRNRKTFEGQFDRLRGRLQQPQEPPNLSAREPSWLGLIDIDHFKAINDGFGHLFGDEVLLTLSQTMMRCFRGSDQLFRFGGEEFVVLLDHASVPGARIVFERLRSAVESHAFPQVGQVTISLGYTKIQPGDVPTLCVERADAALYYAKTHGRNHIRNWEELIASGDMAEEVVSGEIELF